MTYSYLPYDAQIGAVVTIEDAPNSWRDSWDYGAKGEYDYYAGGVYRNYVNGKCVMYSGYVYGNEYDDSARYQSSFAHCG
ncbi:hypothetical protein [Ornithinicoccus hortensis]|uniref:Uncharacterized protein n=1 Tax=Ornithinicoccus hortensis TaxID=82346 RepID=A0A542YT69_9MICO|nr:hypothetical protein [Ornithinicoccus hortensis]TQL51144.1 hypothetical protein FB467_2280 [Ornithinicoccus hortensis]